MSSRASTRISDFSDSVWDTISELVIKNKATNLGKGFPNFPPPQFVLDSASQAVQEDFNQYTRSLGHSNLVNTLSKVFSPLHKRTIDPNTEIITTVGGAESLYCAFQSLLNEGDEAILIEPAFDFYYDQIKITGGVSVGVPLKFTPNDDDDKYSSSDFTLDFDVLEQKITNRTKCIVLNTPHNPTGKIFSLEELEKLSEIAIKYDLIVISDEVYEWMTYEDEHIRIASLPNMFERTLTISSAGKTFSVTGWKLGWTIGPADLIFSMFMVHQRVCFTICTPLQEAVSRSFLLALENNYFEEYKQELKEKRDKLANSLTLAGFKCFIPQGGYMLVADSSNYKLINENNDEQETIDYLKVKQLIKLDNIAAIPMFFFYTKENQHLSGNLIRFCFCKTDELLNEAHEKLVNLSERNNEFINNNNN
eukprot:TRINITY_DN8953_c0_g1_i1.p1 TRINITY_DN8953_c0_g1~~TRINITY_DN8953_c0_g1_i1.p1  ORF type:complete len:421 (+),score=127.50 TRINITY_DN8953_c0_g1_i1:70-1332(+)